MAGKGKLVVVAFKMGAKYGPQIWVASKALREPAKEAAAKLLTSEKARRSAFDRADLTRRLRPDDKVKVTERAKDAADAALRRGDKPINPGPTNPRPGSPGSR